MTTRAATTHALEAALRRLAPGQGRVARRNARRAVRAALREVAEWLDKEYPAPPRKPKQPRKRRTAVERITALHRAGWIEVLSVAAVAAMRDAGCATRTVRDRGGGHRTASGGLVSVFVRRWAHTIYYTRPLADLKRACKSRQFREALLVELALTTKKS